MVEAETSPVSAAVPLHDYSHRLTGWAALFFFSTVALAAQVSDRWDDVLEKDDKFVITVMATSAGLSLLTILGYAIGRDHFAGGYIEGLFAVVCQLFWMIGMVVIMNPDRDIAVSKATPSSTFIRNANIYFFSWGSTIAIVYVLGRYALQIVAHRQNDLDPTRPRLPPKTNLWYLLTLASLVVLVDSVELFRAYTCPGEQDEDLCLATEFAISLGVVGTLFSFGCSVLATMGYMGKCLEFVGAMVMFAFYLTGVGLITFNDGPGTSLGNLYFATWCGCGVAAVLLSRAYMDLLRHFHRKKEEPPKPTKPPADPSTTKVDFPDIEMGNDKQDKKDDDDDDDGEPSWAKEDPEITLPPSKKNDKQSKKDGDNGEPSWAEAETESSASVPPQKKSPKLYTEESIEIELDKDVKLEPKEDTAKPIEKETKSKKDDSGDSEKEDTKKPVNKKTVQSNKEASSDTQNESESEQTKSKKTDNNDSEKEDATTTKPVEGSDSQKEQAEKSSESEKKEEVKSKATPAPKKRNSSKTATTKRNSAKAKAAPKRPSVAKKEKAKADEGSGDGNDKDKLDQSEKEEKEQSTEKITPEEETAKADEDSGDGNNDDKLDESEKEEKEKSTEKSTSNDTEDDDQNLEDKGSF